MLYEAVEKLMKKRNKLLKEIEGLVDEAGMLAIADMMLHAEKTKQIFCINYAINLLGA